ncbi:MAG: NAD-binding protein [Desulfobacterales bacterium]|nr:NAD-binding protein [Desulfobacterales bacterium]
MDKFWIIGGGKFGFRAAQELRKIDSTHQITIVDKQKAVCRQSDRLGFETVCTDGVKYLEYHLTRTHSPDWIVPAIPLHVAYEWIRAKMSARFIIEDDSVPYVIVSELPNPIQGVTGQFFISIADFKCPAGCLEPQKICTYTNKRRPMILHEFLKSIQLKDFTSIVIQSHQLAPGVGGYTPRTLFKTLDRIQTTQKPVLLSTACSCHGIIQTFKHRPK